MADEYIELPTAAARRLVRAIDRRLGHPTRGVQRGPGPHVDLDATGPDGDRSYIGWTVRESEAEDTDGLNLTKLVLVTDAMRQLDGNDLEDPDDPRAPRIRLDLSVRLSEAQARGKRPPGTRRADDNKVL